VLIAEWVAVWSFALSWLRTVDWPVLLGRTESPVADLQVVPPPTG
jgi:hypothetical protein